MPRRWCQTNSISSQLAAASTNVPGTKRPPLGESVGALDLEDISTREAAFLIEVVGDGRVDGGEFLQTSHAPEAQHGPLPSSERQV